MVERATGSVQRSAGSWDTPNVLKVCIRPTLKENTLSQEICSTPAFLTWQRRKGITVTNSGKHYIASPPKWGCVKMLLPCCLLRETADSSQVATWDRVRLKMPESSRKLYMRNREIYQLAKLQHVTEDIWECLRATDTRNTTSLPTDVCRSFNTWTRWHLWLSFHGLQINWEPFSTHYISGL